jgi:hypothetical protein
MLKLGGSSFVPSLCVSNTPETIEMKGVLCKIIANPSEEGFSDIWACSIQSVCNEMSRLRRCFKNGQVDSFRC